MTAPLVTSAKVETFGAHDHVRVWIRGQLAGSLTVGKGDGPELRAALLAATPPAPLPPPLVSAETRPELNAVELLVHVREVLDGMRDLPLWQRGGPATRDAYARIDELVTGTAAPGSTRFVRVALCNDCWDRLNQDRTPVGLREGSPEICNECGKVTVSGLYVRRAQKAAECKAT